MKKLLCLFGRHKWHFTFSFRTGAYSTICERCGKVKDSHPGVTIDYGKAYIKGRFYEDVEEDSNGKQ